MKRGLAAALLLLSFSALAGEDYLPIDPPLQVNSNKILLFEFFYYGCPQCYDLEPFLNDWASRHPEIELVRIPAFRRAWLPLARAYYALVMLGQEGRLRNQIFSVIHAGQMDLDDETTLFSWLEKHGVDMRRFKAIYHSPTVQKKIDESAQLAERLGIAGVPSLVVDGKYLVLGDLARGELLDELVAMAQDRRKQ